MACLMVQTYSAVWRALGCHVHGFGLGHIPTGHHISEFGTEKGFVYELTLTCTQV